jgi:hypothetical protein
MTNQQGNDQWSVADWHGKMLLDRNGAKIGKLQDVYVVETDQPQFATVKEGFIGRHLTFVPLSGAAEFCKGRGPAEGRRIALVRVRSSQPGTRARPDGVWQLSCPSV